MKGPAQGLGVFSTELPSDPMAQALLTLRQDAFRRESRFLNAAEPGYLFRATRVEQAEVDAGLYSNAEIFQLGAQLFHFAFTAAEGAGGADLPPFARFQRGKRGGPDGSSCAQCHWRGGPGGAGDGADNAYVGGDGLTQSSALVRNPRALMGAGLVELLAAEMTTILHGQRESMLSRAASAGAIVKEPLRAKGVEFGVLIARPDGLVDVSEVKGVDADLVVRPFGWKGTSATLREVVEDSLLRHHGMQSSFLVSQGDPERMGPFGGVDPDGDGVTDEITEGQVSVLTLFAAMQEVPTVELDYDGYSPALWIEGEKQFTEFGCAGCHTPSLRLDSALYILPSRVGGAPIVVDLESEGAEPRLRRSSATGEFEVPLFSDLRRHDMGPELAESRWDGTVKPGDFVTAPLWGIARSRPYLHDGHAPTIEDAITLHGGEGAASRDAFFALGEEQRGPLRVYLAALTRARRMVAP
jgi:mono/diheme cytochrome c family protein